jgi:hypothetical protein
MSIKYEGIPIKSRKYSIVKNVGSIIVSKKKRFLFPPAVYLFKSQKSNFIPQIDLHFMSLEVK